MNSCSGTAMEAPRLLSSLDEIDAKGEPLHLALGVFDGVHLGHQAVIASAVHAARAQSGPAVLVTFDPHPIRVLAPSKAPSSLLATLEHKARIVAALGIDHCVALHFDLALASMEASDFLDLLTRGRVGSISVGEDWRFGRNRAGDMNFLKAKSEEKGYQLHTLAPIMFEGERISSTRIRQAIRDGNLDAAAGMLGRPYSVSRKVIHGRQLGGKLGFPTANLDPGDAQMPPDGVWAVKARLENGLWADGVANLGLRPTVDGESRLLEVHLFDLSADLYGQNLEVRFVRHLRPEIRFSSVEALRSQIEVDSTAARALLANPALDSD